jgi:TPR repeat protein
MRRLTQAARKGDADAQYNLGIYCDNHTDDNGYAVADNRAEAIKWLSAAAQQGLPRAQIRLAEMYMERPDSGGSHADACFWLLLAKGNLSNAHREQARSGYERVVAGLSPAQVDAATKRAFLWKPTQSANPAEVPPPESRRRGARP